VAEKELNLLELPAVYMAQLGASTAQVMRSKVFQTEALSTLPDNVPTTFSDIPRPQAVPCLLTAVGTTSFYRVVPEHKRLELGKTWLGAPYRRTRINTAAKYLMLNHAFEMIFANRGELNTDARNVRSQRAMERLGAVRDGVLRCHTIMRDGFVRDTVNYSFTMKEWPATKILLERLLEERTSGAS
jgi:RimJ/RimL family protein N-acetyltransferase